MSDEPTVFVVDDDRAAASSVAALLTSVGLKVETYDSAEAFLTASNSCNGCLVLDVRLNGMSGLELQEVLAEGDVDIPTIIISGHADREASNRALQNGAVACLEKPYDGNELCKAVRTALAKP